MDTETDRESAAQLSAGTAPADARGKQVGTPGRAPRRTPQGRRFTPESAREAALRRHELERERKAEAEKAEAWDALTVSGRFAKSLAREATEEELAAVVRALIAEAKQGKTYAARVLGEWVTKVLPQDEDDVPEGVAWDQLTPAQKAAYRAKIDELLEEARRAESEARDAEASP